MEDNPDLRREDDGLADHLALRVGRDGNCVGSGAGRSAYKVVLAGGGPAAVADVTFGDLAVIGVGGVAREHTETLNWGRKKSVRLVSFP